MFPTQGAPDNAVPDDQLPQPSEAQGEVGLTPRKIAQFSSTFASQMSANVVVWRVCSDIVQGFPSSGPQSGTQWTQATSGVRDFLQPRSLNTNIIQPMWRNVLARCLTQVPGIGVIPASDSNEDLRRQEASQLLLRYHWREAKVDYALAKMIEYAATWGTAATLTYLDEKGNVRHEVVSPDKLRAEPGIGNFSESRFLAVVRLTTKEALKAKYPDKADLIDQLKPPPNYTLTTLSNYTSPAPDRVQVLEAYTATRWYQLTDDGEVLQEGVLPEGAKPLIPFVYQEMPLYPFGQGVVQPTIDMQRTFSSLITQIVDNAYLMSNPKVLIEKNSGVANDAFTSRVGEKVFYKGTKPDVWTPPSLPPYVMNVLPLMQSLAHDATGVHSTSMGKRAVGIDSGRAIDAIAGNDLAQMQVTYDNMNAHVCEMMRNALIYMKHFYPENKQIRMFGPSGRDIFRTLKVTDIVDDPNVFLEADTLFSVQVRNKQAKTLEMLRMGLISQQEAKLQLQHAQDPFESMRELSDMVHARDVLQAAMDGADIRVYPTDNLKAMESTIANFMRSDEYRSLPVEVQERVSALYQQVVQMLMPQPQPGQDGTSLPKPPGVPPDAEVAAGGRPPKNLASAGDVADAYETQLSETEARDQFTQ